MAIVKMKKLQLMVVREQSKQLLRDLTRLGCVEITDSDALLDDESIGSLLHSEYGDAVELNAKKNSLSSALGILDKYVPEKTGLLSAKPEITEEEFLCDDSLEEELGVAARLEKLEAGIRSVYSDESRLRGVAESMTPWVGLDMPLELDKTEYANVTLGAFPSAVKLEAVMQSLAEQAEEAQLFEVHSDKEQHYAVLVSHKDKTEDALAAVRAYGFAQPNMAAVSGTARENKAKALAEIERCKAQREAYISEILSLADHREAIKLCFDRVSTKISAAEAHNSSVGTDKVVCMRGWLTAPEEKLFDECVSKYDCAYELEDPAEEEYKDVPVVLRNNAFTEPLNMATNMYSLPAYGSIDPNPVMSVFFILFYGIMMADMGYGLLMIAFALFAIKKAKPRQGKKYFFGLMLECGISTFIMGILSGGLFSNLVPTVCDMFGVECGIKLFTQPLIDPLNDTTTVLVGGMLLGVIHLFTGMFTNWYMKARDGHFMDGVWDEGTWMVLLIGLALYFAPKLGIDINNTPGLVMLIVGGLMLVYGSGRNEKGIKKRVALGGAIYNGVTGWFGDILSYSRLMALMLAGSVVGQVFNTLAAMPSEGGVTVVSMIAFVLIFLVGHAINFGLNILGCFAHDLRLQCLEFFGKFYQDGGKPFRPLQFNSKFVDVEPTVN